MQSTEFQDLPCSADLRHPFCTSSCRDLLDRSFLWHSGLAFALEGLIIAHVALRLHSDLSTVLKKMTASTNPEDSAENWAHEFLLQRHANLTRQETYCASLQPRNITSFLGSEGFEVLCSLLQLLQDVAKRLRSVFWHLGFAHLWSFCNFSIAPRQSNTYQPSDPLLITLSLFTVCTARCLNGRISPRSGPRRMMNLRKYDSKYNFEFMEWEWMRRGFPQLEAQLYMFWESRHLSCRRASQWLAHQRQWPAVPTRCPVTGELLSARWFRHQFLQLIESALVKGKCYSSKSFLLKRSEIMEWIPSSSCRRATTIVLSAAPWLSLLAWAWPATIKTKNCAATHGSKSLRYTQQWPKLPLCYFVCQLPGKTLTHYNRDNFLDTKLSPEWENFRLRSLEASHLLQGQPWGKVLSLTNLWNMWN